MNTSSAHEQPIPEFLVRPIGFIRTAMRTKFETPHQPKNGDKVSAANVRNVIELLPGNSYEQALRDLEGFDRIWLVWWFDRNATWKPLVLPPRGKAHKRGVFATRSPHRPNPIGISAVELIEVRGRKLVVGEVDLLDGTPILDLKPYLKRVDAFPAARCGWVDQLEEELQRRPEYLVEISAVAELQLAWLETQWGIDLLSSVRPVLERDPSPHRTRRISKVSTGYRMGCGAWRVYFLRKGKRVLIQRIACGYPERSLFDSRNVSIPDKDAQIAFAALWRSANGSAGEAS